MPIGSAAFSPNCSARPSRRSGASANSMRRKNVPPSGSVEYWSERTMFAPFSYRKRETPATIPGRSGQEISSRSSPGAAALAVIEPCSRGFERHRHVVELGEAAELLDADVDLGGGQALHAFSAELLDA